MTFTFSFWVWFSKNLPDLEKEIFNDSEFFEFQNVQKISDAEKKMEEAFTPLWNLEERFPMIRIPSIAVSGVGIDVHPLCEKLRACAGRLNKNSLREIETIR
jgi:hypothetical protein